MTDANKEAPAATGAGEYLNPGDLFWGVCRAFNTAANAASVLRSNPEKIGLVIDALDGLKGEMDSVINDPSDPLRAQPQAREEAQPGRELIHGEVTDDWAERFCEAVNWSPDGQECKTVEGQLRCVTFRELAKGYILSAIATDPCTNTPAPEAEKLRVAEAEVRLIESISRAVEQDFDALEAAWPQSKRGSRAQKAYDQIKGRWEGVRACARDALAALQQEGKA